MSGASSTLPDAMIDLVDRLIDAADRRGWRRRGKSAGGLRDAQDELVMRRAALIAALDVPAAWRDVAIERRRQINAEGRSLEHDDGHVHGEIALAAAQYLLPSDKVPDQSWARSKAKHDRRRQLVIGTALGLAEIERIDRAAAREAASPAPVLSDPTPLPPQAAAAIAAARAID